MRWPLSFCLLLAVLPACGQAVQIRVEENKDLNSRHYLLTQDDCKILWRLQFFQSGKGFGIREEVECSLPLSAQIPLREALLQKVAAETEQMQGMRNFVWSKVQNKDVFMPRLAKALAASGQWNAATGQASGKAANDLHFLRDLMNQQQIFAEVAASFAAHGWALSVVDVEKVQVGQTGLGDVKGIYPLDCAIVFSVRRQLSGK